MPLSDLIFADDRPDGEAMGKVCFMRSFLADFRPCLIAGLILPLILSGEGLAQTKDSVATGPSPLTFSASEASFTVLGEADLPVDDDKQEQTLQPSAMEISPALIDPALSETNGAQLPLDGSEEVGPNASDSLSTSEVIDQPITESTDGSGLADFTPQAAGTDASDTIDTESEGAVSKIGPRIRSPLSLLFAEQRPFLLHSQDASITYLMPHAVIGFPEFGRHLRSILEDRALNHWMIAQKEADKRAKDKATSLALVVNGRVEDRFSSDAFASLFLNEDRTQPSTDGKAPSNESILTFNYDYRNNMPLMLETLFGAESDRDNETVVSLMAAYIRADIIRQKSIRLGTDINAEQDAWVKEFEPSLEQLQVFTLVPSRTSGKIAGLEFSFQPGQLGAPTDGPYHVYVPSAIFKPNLAKDYADFFADDALNVSSFNAAGFSNATVHLQNMREGSELGGMMVIEGEVPNNWCDGFHLSLTEKGSIIAEAQVELLPELPPYGISSHMVRFRAEMTVNGEGGKKGQLIFEPYRIQTEAGRLKLRKSSACKADASILQPQPEQDSIRFDVIY